MLKIKYYSMVVNNKKPLTSERLFVDNYRAGLSARGCARSTNRVRPSSSVLLSFSTAARASSSEENSTKPKPLLRFSALSMMMFALTTVPTEAKYAANSSWVVLKEILPTKTLLFIYQIYLLIILATDLSRSSLQYRYCSTVFKNNAIGTTSPVDFQRGCVQWSLL